MVFEILFILNLILLFVYYMHMFQLNSYFFKKYMHWFNQSKKGIITRTILSLLPAILYLFNNTCKVIAFIILTISIIYNIPKKKAKISIKFTKRVNRMFVTEAILMVIILILNSFVKNTNLIYIVLSILAPFMCIIANFINKPIEHRINMYYINDAKRILAEQKDLLVIGVTGSYGKTSVKNFLYQMLSKKYEVLQTPKNYNTTMGVVRTIRENLKPYHQIFICEMGATKVNDIKEICDLVHPKLGVITAIGPQHLQSFKSIDNIIKTKFELADAVAEAGGKIFLNCNNEYINSNKDKYDFVSYGVNDDKLEYNAHDIKMDANEKSFKVKDKRTFEDVKFETNIIGKQNIMNLTGAMAVANYLGIDLKTLKPVVRKMQNVEHRLQPIHNGNVTIIDDAYNSNPISSKYAIDTLKEFNGTRIIVTPGLIELGDEQSKYNYEFGEYMGKNCDYIYIVKSPCEKDMVDGIKATDFDNSKLFKTNSAKSAVQEITNMHLKGEVVILLENDLPDNYNV